MFRFTPVLGLLAGLVVASPALAVDVLADSTLALPDGARPGNIIGTGQSLPRGNKASNINASDASSVIAPNLPAPSLADSASVPDYLRAARRALDAHRTGQAQQALEMASTRALDRVVGEGDFHASHSPLIDHIHDALQALSAQDFPATRHQIDEALNLARH